MIITTFAFVKETCYKNRPDEKTTDKIGRTAAALVILGGLASLYILSVYGMMGQGPFAGFDPIAHKAILGTLATIEGLTILGLFIKSVRYCRQPSNPQIIE